MTDFNEHFERVYTWPAYWDGPREGVADFEGQPHRFVADWNSAGDDYADTFSLYPIDDETLNVAVEQWAIWRRWVAAHMAGATTLDTHPALPEDRERNDALEEQWKSSVAGLVALPRHVTAEFRRVHDEFYNLTNATTLEVRWRLVALPPYNGAFTVGSRVRVLSRSMLEQFQGEWEYHNPLTDEQLEFAGTIDVVADVAYYHGGDPLYRLRHTPGTWHETCLRRAD